MQVLDYSGEGAEFTGFATGLGEGIKQIKKEEQREADRAFAEQVRQIEYEMDLEKMRAAHALDLEKMMQRSMNDFTREEQRRQMALDKYENTMKYLEEHGDEFDEEQIQFVKTNSYLNLIGSGVKLPASSFYDEPQELRQPSVSEKMRAFGMLEDIEQPGFGDKALSKLSFGMLGKSELTPLEKQQEQYLQEVIGNLTQPQQMQPAGISRIPRPITREEYDAIPIGSEYISSTGQIKIKG